MVDDGIIVSLPSAPFFQPFSNNRYRQHIELDSLLQTKAEIARMEQMQ